MGMSISVDAIQVGDNPRGYFNKKAVQSLAASMATYGLIQPITVRSTDEGRYQLIAGERRLRAAKTLGWTEIEVTIKDGVDADKAFEMATVENVVRENMSPTEEADAVVRILDLVQGNIAEAAKRLGRSEKFVRARLALARCTDAVKQALTVGDINLGTAELLATLPGEVQEATLPKLVEQGVSTADLKGRILSALAQQLSTAKFDVAACGNCTFNSTTVVQGDLFGETIGEGHCTSPECWREKTLAWISQTLRPELLEDYPQVFIEDEERTLESGRTVNKTRVDGEQFAACQECQQYGALIRTSPGHEGEVRTGLCFQTECLTRAEKVHARGVANAADPSSTTAAKRGTETSKAATPAKKKAPAETPKGVERSVDTFLRTVATNVVAKDANVQRSLLLVALLKDCGTFIPQTVEFERQTDRADLFRAVFKLSHEEQSKLLNEALQWIAGKMNSGYAEFRGEAVRVCEAVIQCTEEPLNGQFTFTEEFLKAHRKSGLIQVLKDSGFAKHYDAVHGEKSFSKLAKGKLTEIITAVLEEKYDLGQFVPKVISRRIATPHASAGTQAH